ncbi:MAG: hypothetical protein AUH82_00725 [Chloroflexi bacterium 13_1_40CM_4_65_13]|nr:MAG: hypothetical protein AUH82_00725 [Chloroflexi bacterium 13_1_40CM_4_65_13]
MPDSLRPGVNASVVWIRADQVVRGKRDRQQVLPVRRLCRAILITVPLAHVWRSKHSVRSGLS